MRGFNRDDTLLVQALRTSPASSGCVQELYIVVHYFLLRHIEQQPVKFFWDILTLNAIYSSASPNYLTVDFNKMSQETAKFLEHCQKTHRHFILVFFRLNHFFGEYWLLLHITIKCISTYSAVPTRFSDSRIVLNRIS